MFLYSKWLSLDLPTRMKIAGIFDIVKRGSTHVVDNRIQSDGYNIEEVEAKLSVENLQKYLVTKEKDPEVLWDMFTARMEGREIEQVETSPAQASVASVLPPEEAKQFKKEHKARVAAVKKKTLSEKVKAVKKNVTKRITKKK